MLSFFLVAGIGSYLIVGLLCVAAFAVAGVGAYFYLRAKNREALDPAKGLVAGDAPVALGEMRELTSRIEEIVTSQQDHGETQRAHLARKIDQVRESVESQHHAVSGLRGELRHEIAKRDAEMTEIRHQIAAVREGVGLPPAERAALPPGPSAADLGAPETQAEMASISFDEPEEAVFTEMPAAPPEAEAPAFDEMAFAPLDAEPGDSGLDFAFEEDEAPAEAPTFFFEDETFENAAEMPDPLAPETDEFGGMPFAFAEEAPAAFVFEEGPPTEEVPHDEAEAPAFSFEEEEPTAFSFDEAPSLSGAEEAQMEPEAEVPAFTFEEEAPVEEAEADAFQVVSFLEPTPEDEMPAFAFEEEPVSEYETPASSFDEVPAFSFGEESPVEEADDALAFSFEETEPSEFVSAEADETPMALAFEEEQEDSVQAEVTTAGFAEARFEASAPLSGTPAPSPTFAPALHAPAGDTGPGAPPPSAWISRPDRQPDEAPVETIGGIAVERVGDVPPAEPTPSDVPDLGAEAGGAEVETPESHMPAVESIEVAMPEVEMPEVPAAPLPAYEPDEFPEPVVASELAVESFDFGIDVDAELEAAGQAPIEFGETVEPEAAYEDAPAPVEPIRHAPVPPFRMEPEAVEPEPEPTPVPPPVADPEPVAEVEEIEPYDPPEGAEDLTIISSVDMDTQRALHMAGVLTLDEIARWGRTDARRIGAEVGVSEETIMHQWVFEAQSALFERYSRR